MDARIARLLLSHALASTAMSVPWPWLLVLVWDDTHDPTLLGLAAAARLAPYVACSWWVSRVGDRLGRDLVVRATIGARLVLFVLVAVALAAHEPLAAVLLATAAITAATPSYPALAASVPAAAGRDAERVTRLLVTIEVAGFMVGPAVGGLLLAAPSAIMPATIAATAAAYVLMRGVRLPAATRSGDTPVSGWTTVRDSAPIRRALTFMALLNLLDVTVGLTLLLMAQGSWTGRLGEDTTYGLASGALGLGALVAPAMARCGSDAVGRARIGIALTGAGVLATAGSPMVLWALLPLGLAGAASVHAESAATGIIQAEAPDEVRAAMFGLADTCMVGAAMVGALLAPVVAAAISPPLLMLGLAAVAGGSAAIVRRAPAQQRPVTAVPPISSSVSTDVAKPAAASRAAVRSA
jgi:MFS family permease